jgi:hypothetical protein
MVLMLVTTAFQSPTVQLGSTVPAAGAIGQIPPAGPGSGTQLYLPVASNAGSIAAPAPTKTPVPTAIPTATQPPASGDWQPGFPIRAAFYYPWFPESWTQSGTFPFTNYHPSLGYYSAADKSTVQKHIAAMQYGNMQAGIASWWGQGHHTDKKMNVLLQAAADTKFRWSVYYENESMSDPSVAQIRNDLTYLRDQYGKNPAYLRVNGKFVVFVYSWTNDVCGMADRWKQANTVGAYIVLKVFPGYASCASQPDARHQYAPAVAADEQAGESYNISPGFWLWGQPVRLGRNLTQWTADVQKMFAANVKFQLVTTFNEWGEGTSVESATEWASPSGYGKYMDALHNFGK